MSIAVSTIQQFMEYLQNANSGDIFSLDNDIRVLPEDNFTSINVQNKQITIEGNHKKIVGLTTSLFNSFDAGEVVINNLEIVVDIDYDAAYAESFGAFAGFGIFTMNNCIVRGSIRVYGVHEDTFLTLGGFIGGRPIINYSLLKCELHNCVNYAEVVCDATPEMAAYIGGIFGCCIYNKPSYIINECYNYGLVACHTIPQSPWFETQHLIQLGGIVGVLNGRDSNPITVLSSVNYGSIVLDVPAGLNYNASIGGIVGDVDACANVEYCKNYGRLADISPNSQSWTNAVNREGTGGIVGRFVATSSCVLIGCVSAGNIAGGRYTGGLMGSITLGGSPSQITDNVVAHIMIQGAQYVGGVSGIIYYSFIITNTDSVIVNNNIYAISIESSSLSGNVGRIIGSPAASSAVVELSNCADECILMYGTASTPDKNITLTHAPLTDPDMISPDNNQGCSLGDPSTCTPNSPHYVVRFYPSKAASDNPDTEAIYAAVTRDDERIDMPSPTNDPMGQASAIKCWCQAYDGKIRHVTAGSRFFDNARLFPCNTVGDTEPSEPSVAALTKVVASISRSDIGASKMLNSINALLHALLVNENASVTDTVITNTALKLVTTMSVMAQVTAQKLCCIAESPCLCVGSPNQSSNALTDVLTGVCAIETAVSRLINTGAAVIDNEADMAGIINAISVIKGLSGDAAAIEKASQHKLCCALQLIKASTSV
ncbi:hypothetical protein AGMMS49992_17650 [Clostridia bacterium]|nr:hypothetical protein AGMMS49992_17650 [Clostridia bacterium]